MKSSTDMDAPSRATPKTASEDPNRDNPRSAIVAPSCVTARTEMEAPRVSMPQTGDEDSGCVNDCRDISRLKPTESLAGAENSNEKAPCVGNAGSSQQNDLANSKLPK